MLTLSLDSTADDDGVCWTTVNTQSGSDVYVVRHSMASDGLVAVSGVVGGFLGCHADAAPCSDMTTS